jgi:rfaE bifunctional protein nucleotidyltransferase chain/domain
MSFHSRLRYKIATRAEIESRLLPLKKDGKKVVFTNGCFDLLHPGHVDYLCRARDLGDFLVVGLNTDASVQSLQKAPGRPVNSENARAIVLAGLECVDAVVLFNEPTPYDLIRFIQPHILVKGDDYKVEEIVGHDIVTASGGKVITIPFLEGFSTTAIIKKITG